MMEEVQDKGKCGDDMMKKKVKVVKKEQLGIVRDENGYGRK